MRMISIWRWITFLIGLHGGIAHGQSDQVVQRFPFEVVLDITWQGRDIRIRKILACNMRERLRPFVWDQDVSRIAHVLPNDEVLIITVPGVCGGLNQHPRSTALSPLPQGYMPLMYWIDSASNPEQAEQIVSARYFEENPRRRFTARRFSVKPVSNALTQDIEHHQPLVWLIDSLIHRPHRYLAGAPVVVFPKSVWSRFPKLNAMLSQRNESGEVEASVIRRVALDLVRSCIHPVEGISAETPCRVGFADDRVHVLGAALHQHSWRVLADDWGVIRYTHLVDADAVDARGCNAAQPTCNLRSGQMILEIEGRQVAADKRGEYHFHFDAARGNLIRFRYALSGSARAQWERK